METEYTLSFGAYEGFKISSKRIPREYLVRLEEDLLLKGRNTSTPLMIALDKEIKKRSIKKDLKTILERPKLN